MRAWLPILLFIVALSAACGPAEERLDIPFAVTFDGATLDCEKSAGEASLTDLRFYVHDVALLKADGSATPVRLTDDATWQAGRIALLDLESGKGDCLNGTFPQHTRLQGAVEEGDYVGLRFVLGVPFELNHKDPLQASAPLNDSAMHWHWRSGYKFFRAGVRTPGDRFWVHVGSTGCEGTVNAISACSAPNRPVVVLRDFDPWQDAVSVDLFALVADGRLADGVASDCSSGPAEESCAAPFEALGIDFPEGTTHADQRVFSKRVLP